MLILQKKDGYYETALASEIISQSPDGFWPMVTNGGTFVRDLSGNDYNGTASTSSILGNSTGLIPNNSSAPSAKFDEAGNEQINLDSYSNTFSDSGYNKGTVSFCIRLANGSSGNDTVFSFSKGTSSYDWFGMFATGNEMRFILKDGGPERVKFDVGYVPTFRDGVTKHIAVVFDGTHPTEKYRAYVDGVQQTPIFYTGGLTSNWWSHNMDGTFQNFRIGYTRIQADPSFSYPMQGELGYLAIWSNTALSGAQILSQYQAGTT